MTIKHKSVAEQLKEKGFKAPGIYRVVDGEVILGPLVVLKESKEFLVW